MLEAPSNHFIHRPVCPGCGNGSARTLISLHYDSEPLAGFLARFYRRATDITTWCRDGLYQLDECATCGLVFQRFVGDDRLLTELYDRWITPSRPPEQEPAIAAMLARPKQSRDGHELMAVASFLRRPIQELKVFDYGMGWGLWAQVAHRLGAQSYGYDVAPSRCEYVATRGVKPIPLETVGSYQFDLINTEQVLEHLSQPSEVVRLLASALRPGGILKISVPHAPDLERRLEVPQWEPPPGTRGPLTAVQPLEHVNCFSERSLVALAHSVGLMPVTIPLRAYFAFVRHPGAIPLRDLRSFAKAWTRPLYHRLSQENLYMWFQKPHVSQMPQRTA